MTYREKIVKEKPDHIDELYVGGVMGCPGHYFDGAPTNKKPGKCIWHKHGDCVKCWNMEAEDKT